MKSLFRKASISFVITAGTRIANEASDPKKIPVDRTAIDAQRNSHRSPRTGLVSTWARLIKRVYEVDPLRAVARFYPHPCLAASTSGGQVTAAGSAVRIRVGSGWRVSRSPVSRDAGGGIARVTVGLRPRVPVTGLVSFFAAITPDASSVPATGRLKALRSPIRARLDAT